MPRQEACDNGLQERTSSKRKILVDKATATYRFSTRKKSKRQQSKVKMVADIIGLGEGVALFIFFLIGILSSPLPRSFIELLLSLKPNIIVLVAAAATSLVPLVENTKFLYEYRPRNELGGAAYETDPRFLQSQVALLRAVVVLILLLVFVLTSRIATEMVKAQAACEKMEKNLFAMKKQAQQANAATMKMMDETTNDTTTTPGPSSDIVGKLKKENATLNEKLGSTAKELEVVKTQAKGFQREHDRLLSQIQELENQLDKNPTENKKSK